LHKCPLELQLVRASAAAAVDLIPCDVTDFLTMFAKFSHDLATLVVLVLLQEPSSTAVWVATGVPGTLATTSADAFAQSLLEVVKAMHEKPPISEMRQLNPKGMWYSN
jgi:hypothetical protein